jgi:hypothetical protein
MSSHGIKNILLHISGNQNYKLRHPGPPEGRFAIVTMRWAGNAMDALASGAAALFRKDGANAPDETPRRTAKSCGPDTRCWCQVLREVAREMTVTNQNSLTGESTK